MAKATTKPKPAVAKKPTTATKAAPAKAKTPRAKRELKVGMKLRRRFDGAIVEIVKLEGDDETGTVTLKSMSDKGRGETVSKIKYARRRFGDVK